MGPPGGLSGGSVPPRAGNAQRPTGGLLVIRKLPKYLNEAQMIALVCAPDLLAAEGVRDRAILAMLCATGLRPLSSAA
jgi:site-specific recombinase XerC